MKTTERILILTRADIIATHNMLPIEDIEERHLKGPSYDRDLATLLIIRDHSAGLEKVLKNRWGTFCGVRPIESL
jgi:hypothetical protein